MQSDWKDRKGRFSIHHYIRRDVSGYLPYRQSDRVFFFFFLWVLVVFWGAFDTRSRVGENSLKTASSFPVLLAASRWPVCIQLLAVLKHTFVSPFPRAKCSFGARGALTPFTAAVVALEPVESRQSEHSSSSGVAKRSSITRTAAIG